MVLEQLIQQVKAYEPRVLQDNQLAKAGVLLAITDHPQTPEIILTLRSQHLPTHKGEVAFPGGKMEQRDQNVVQTALREAEEEIGLDPSLVTVVGELDQVVSRFGFLVTPVLGIVPHELTLTPEPDEIESIFRVPITFFTARQPDQIDQFGQFRGPRWYYEDYTIWGLTAMMLGEFFNQFYDQGIEICLGDVAHLLNVGQV